MTFNAPRADELTTESDVEQKLLYPLLTTDHPFGLGLKQMTILTKASIRRFPIGKGNDRKLYYPDYLVLIDGFPVLVVEAKTPGEGITEAFREARLYATELNALYPESLNPLTKILASDGLTLAAGSWDHATPAVTAQLSDLVPSSIAMGTISDLVGSIQLQKDFARFSKALKPAHTGSHAGCLAEKRSNRAKSGTTVLEPPWRRISPTSSIPPALKTELQSRRMGTSLLNGESGMLTRLIK